MHLENPLPSNRAIVVVGSLNMDLVVRTPRHPEVGETILGTDFQTFPGGKGANQAVSAARLGGQVRMIGKVGADAFGEALLQTVTRDGVDATYIQRDPQVATGVALITVNDLGQNNIVVVPGANARLQGSDVLQAEAAFEGAGVLLLQFEIPLPAVRQAITLARKHGVQVVLNPAPAQELEGRFLASVDYLIPNQNELALLAGVDDTDSAAGMLRDLGVRHLIVTLGNDGVLVVEDHHPAHLAAHPVDVVDTTAAGDAFVGAFAVALTEGKGTRAAAAWGNAAGAISVTRPGAQPSLPYRAELESFLANHGQSWE
jgi:ribokinase